MKYQILIILLFSAFAVFGQEMTNEEIGKLLSENAGPVEGADGGWQVTVDRRPLLIVTDESANRLRVFTFVAEINQISTEELEVLLRANFTDALDAKYAIYEGLVVSVFTHPMRELTKLQLLDAIKQVNNLAENFGTSYSSTEVRFGLEWEAVADERRVNVRPPTRGWKN